MMYVFVLLVHSSSGDNCIFGQKYSSARNGVYMFENMWHMLVNVTIRLWCIYWNTQAFHMLVFLHCHSHSEVELCSGTAFVCENSSSP